MRRKVFAFTALMALLICGVAVAATSAAGNKYTASVTAKANGSAKKPAVTSVVQTFTIKNLKSGQNAYPATNINTTIGNLKVENAKSYPTCSAAKINSAGNGGGWNKVCNSKSEIASGPVNATIYAKKNTSPSTDIIKSCKLTVHVYNAGQGKLTFFLTTGSNQCGILTTGAAQAWTATYKESGSSLVMNVPLPPDVSTNAGGLGWSAINSETLNFKKLDTGGKPVIVSTGCKANKRSESTTFSANTGSKTVKATVSGKTAC